MRSAAVGVGMLAVTAGIVGPASATPTPLAAKSQTVTTSDGWQMTVAASDIWVNPVPNLAGSPFTREGFVSATVTGDVTGAGEVPVASGSIEQGLQVGCAIAAPDGLTVGSTATFGPSVTVSMTGPAAGLDASAGPSVSMRIKPGEITEVPLGDKPLETDHASISAHNVHVKVDNCLGQVTIRTYARMDMSTRTSDDSVYVYSDPTWL